MFLWPVFTCIPNIPQQESSSLVTREFAETLGTLKAGQQGIQQQITDVKQQVGELKGAIEQSAQGLRQELDARLTGIDRTQTETNAWVRQLASNAVSIIGVVGAVVIAVVGGVITLWYKIGGLERGLTEVAPRFAGLQKQMDVRFSDFQTQMDGTFTSFQDQVMRLYNSVNRLESVVARLEQQR